MNLVTMEKTKIMKTHFSIPPFNERGYYEVLPVPYQGKPGTCYKVHLNEEQYFLYKNQEGEWIINFMERGYEVRELLRKVIDVVEKIHTGKRP